MRHIREQESGRTWIRLDRKTVVAACHLTQHPAACRCRIFARSADAPRSCAAASRIAAASAPAAAARSTFHPPTAACQARTAPAARARCHLAAARLSRVRAFFRRAQPSNAAATTA